MNATAPTPEMPQDLAEAQRALVAARASVDELKQRLQLAQWQIDQLKRSLFGATSERTPKSDLSPEQALLELLPPPAEPPAAAEVLTPEPEPAQPAPVRRPRQPALRELETVTERIEPAERVCPHCGQAKCEIGCERSERYEYVPARVIRHEIVRPRLACPCGQGSVSIAPLPPTPLPKGLAGASLLAQVILAKYDDHLPLYRQEQQFARLGVNFPRQTLSDWVAKGAEWLQLLVHRLKLRLLAGDYLQVDETPIKVLDPDVKGRCATGYLWVLSRPGGDVLFEFHTGRGKEHAQELLPGYTQGYLQRDGYSVYGSLARDHPGLRPVGCGAHLRRKFFNALSDEPVHAQWFLHRWRQLYAWERVARERGLDSGARHTLRQEHARPIVEEMKRRLDELAGSSLLPQSPLGKAVRYARDEWEAWTTYLEDGRLEIDNNLTENSLRPACVGKKNYLFIGHPDAGWRSATIYTLIASCRRRKLDPWAYLTDVLQRLPSMTNQEIDVLLPENWQPAVKEPAA